MRQGPFKSRFHSFLALYSLLPFLRQAFPRTSLFIPINKLPCVFVIYCSSFSQLLNYNIWCREIQQSLPAPQVMLGPWTHSAYIVHFPTIFVPLSLHRGTVPFRNLSFLSPGSHGQFFSTPLHIQSSNIFAFTWADTDLLLFTQITWLSYLRVS